MIILSTTSIAGTDTTAITSSYTCWELSRRPDIMRKLQNEIDEVMPDSRSIPKMHVLQTLPYLNAVIKEGSFAGSCALADIV
jgi:cytochrome P450